MFNLLDKFLNTLMEYNTADIPNMDISYYDFIQSIADGSASGMEFNNGVVTMRDNDNNILIWDILSYSCTYNGTCFLLSYYQPYTDKSFIAGLVQ